MADINLDRKYRKITFRNLAVVLASILILMIAVETVLFVLNKTSKASSDNDAINIMCYEKTPVESLLTVAETNSYRNEYVKMFAGYRPAKFPLIGDLRSSASFDENTVRIVVIGDSFTYGQASINRNGLFWRQAEQILRAKGYNV